MSSSAASAGADPAPSALAVICGPTAAGKSRIAMWLAQRRPVTIISADSRQVYRDFDVGTAKPTAEEQARVPHRGLDVVPPTARYSAADWSALAHAAIADARGAGRVPVVVGGTGFYIRALAQPLWDEPVLDAARRARLQERLLALETSELRRWCEALDPARAHLGQAQLVRAVEIALLTGERLSALHVARSRPGVFRPSYLLVDPGTELSSRIAARASAMLASGWIDEVRSLVHSVPVDAPAWNATGYRIVRQLVQNEIDRDTALERIIIETRQYAKRQRTWFRHQLEPDRVHRIAPDAPGWQEQAERWIARIAGASSVHATNAS